ncbi:MAG TPA: hypothetical protein VI796_03930 [Candidatus Thermoplasmatota archaeon]|nr:hypothetical protein [Candidatus Thermoplasmatota archaeon]
MATTPCPGCGKGLKVPKRGVAGRCPACGLAVRFVEAPERGCLACGKTVAFPPGTDAARCPSCGTWQAAEPDRAVVGRATCPRCRRAVAVAPEATEASCPYCRSRLLLADTL